MHYALVLLALGALLALHELGHLVAARLLGVRVPRFVFGFGPPMASFRLGGTQFVVGAVPLGATVHIQGMNPHRADASETASFQTLGPVRRALIILAGPLANYLFALGVLFALYTSGTHVVVPLTVGTVKPGSEAARAQLLPGDRIDMVDGQPLRSWTEFVEKVAVGVGRPLDLRVERHGEARTVTVRPRPDEQGEGRIGVSQQYVYRTHAPGEALRHSLVHTMNIASEGVTMFLRLAKGDPAHGGPAGPGALVRQESSDAASSGLDSVLRALVAASVALALLTLLPVPGLDGGRVLLLMIEAVSGRRLPPRVETLAQTMGFLAISAIIVAVAATEIRSAVPERFKSKPQTGGDSTSSPAASAGVPGTPQGGPAALPATSAPATGTTTATPPTVTGAPNATPSNTSVTPTPAAGAPSAPATGAAPAIQSPMTGGAPASAATATASPATGGTPATPTPATGGTPATPTPATGGAPATPAGTTTATPPPATGGAPATPAGTTTATPPPAVGGASTTPVGTGTATPSVGGAPATPTGTATTTPATTRADTPAAPSPLAGAPAVPANPNGVTSATQSPPTGTSPATPSTSTGAATTSPRPSPQAPSNATTSAPPTPATTGAGTPGGATPTAAPSKVPPTSGPAAVSGPPTP
ncbi:M50A family peptidase [Myxococcus stipitatus DSM 14675]|uniref:M50A family peptidase n=1 Tax=Myxococcus stipitatus (strain DSM 14675 / JCM 12634 / Mx s8) TaxID=1278073 RepID=L7UCT6_MYXSD|nr:site-2 protease family protein [Myxococcus stipitatus]AGC44274.1 M50A family peptidase [Myxococcus stipitatus DSM 14675]